MVPSRVVPTLLLWAVPLAAQAPSTPRDVVAAFHTALEEGDSARALSFLDPDVLIFESGGIEASRAEYASHHLPADMAFSRATDREVLRTWSEIEGELAVLMSETRTTGTYREREIDSRGIETIMLVRRETGWKIVHIHWSSRANRRS